MGKSVTTAPSKVQPHYSSCFFSKAAGTLPSHTIRDLGSDINGLHPTITTSVEAPAGLLTPVAQQTNVVAGTSQAKYRAMLGILTAPMDATLGKCTV